MLKYNDICKNLDEKYHEMIKQVNIVEFTKCIADFSGLQLDKVSDESICTYLTTWAKNKYRFFELLDKKLVKDTKISYIDESRDKNSLMRELQEEFPIFATWIDGFIGIKSNKINTSDYYFNWNFGQLIRRVFPNCSLDGCLLTHFFKSYLKAPDELVTKIGRLFENEKVEANYTISIDPVDIMLASENPYDWHSCYSMEGSHADGCLAAMLDNTSLVTYVWNKEGKFILDNKYDFKNIRFKRMRAWISVNLEQTAIYFHEIYPGKCNYSKEFHKTLRVVCEDWLNKNATWVKIGSEDGDPCADELVEREYYYGYNEFDYDNAYKIKGSEIQRWSVYNEEIICPCGCGEYLPGSDDDDNEDRFNGNGFIAENYTEQHYCEYIDDYCDCEDCYGCEAWNREHAVCELDEDRYCENYLEAEDEGNFEPYNSNVVHCDPEFCAECPFHKQHFKEIRKDKEEEDEKDAE